MANKPLLDSNRLDDFQTPPEALSALLPYLPRRVWECACGEGYLVASLLVCGFDVIASDIGEGHDFLSWTPPLDSFDCIVTNPPYTLKDKFLERCYTIGKPFALLLPLTTLEGKRQRLLEQYGVEIVLLDKRVNFITPSGQGSGSWFATAWFTNWLGIGSQLAFGKIVPLDGFIDEH